MTQSSMPSLERWQDKLCSAGEAVQLIRNGQRVFVGTASATPRTLMAALEARSPPPTTWSCSIF